ncbi:MAG: DUF5659 domain-containing protein [bacterium]|nr:DUF5659 domain-containing protein [bacterium]
MKITKTSDLYEAGALQAYSGFSPIKLEEEEGIITFIFEGEKEAEEIIQLFWNGQLMVSARKYAEALKSLKERIHRKR